ncbi:hypothetical protein Tco_1089709, partial [Tanacetum coccineum]
FSSSDLLIGPAMGPLVGPGLVLDGDKGNDRRALRILMRHNWKTVEKISNESLCEFNLWRVVGSSNGLVCFSRLYKDGLTVINNPWTREVTKLPMSPLVPEKVGSSLSLGFGYTGILCNGALHWFVVDHRHSSEDPDRVILSFDLFREEFTVIPEPNDSDLNPSRPPTWRDSWELLSNDCEIKYEVVHYMNMLDCNSPKKMTTGFFCNYNNKCLSRAWKYISAQKFVPSLVSPVYVHTGRPSPPKNNNKSIEMWSAKVAEGECPDLPEKIRNFVKTTEHADKIYRREVRETVNLYLQEDGETKIEIEDGGSHTMPLCAERG